MDVIRCVALFTVLSVHFFSKVGLYGITITGKKMYCVMILRTFFMICVPLFVMLTGYLMRKKELNRQYYSKIWHVIWIYVLASLACVGYRIFFKHEILGLKDIISGLLNYSLAPYGWYIEMYIGLFVIIPFLNVLYNHLDSRKKKVFLIVVMLFLTSVGDVVNVYNFETAGWWQHPRLSGEYQKLLPFWWGGCYPITYYFIGCYLNEFGMRIKKTYNLMLIFFSTIVFGTYNFWRNYGERYVDGAWQNYGSLFTVIISVLVFVFFLNLNYEKLPTGIQRIFQTASRWCLGAYLVSWIFDSICYGILNGYVVDVRGRFIYYLPTVLIIYICSLTLSAGLNLVSKIPMYCKMKLQRVRENN